MNTFITRISAFFFSSALIVFVLPCCITAEEDVSIRAFLDTSEVVVGEELHFHLEFTWQGSDELYRIRPPKLKLINLNLKEVASRAEKDLEKEGTRQKRIFVYSLQALRSGTGAIESATIDYYKAGSEEPLVRNLPSFDVRISLPLSTKKLIFLSGLGLLAVILLILIISILIKKKRKKAQAQKVEATLEDKILDDLEALKVKILEGEYSQFFGRLQEIVKKYLHLKYAFSLTGDIKESIEKKELFSNNEKKLLLNILTIAEEAKYSGIDYERNFVEELYDSIQQFIHDKRTI